MSFLCTCRAIWRNSFCTTHFLVIQDMSCWVRFCDVFLFYLYLLSYVVQSLKWYSSYLLTYFGKESHRVFHLLLQFIFKTYLFVMIRLKTAFIYGFKGRSFLYASSWCLDFLLCSVLTSYLFDTSYILWIEDLALLIMSNTKLIFLI